MNEGWNIHELSAALDAELVGAIDGRFAHVLIDSRKLTFPAETVFFALRTAKDDGHKYIHRLYDRGVRAFAVEEIPEPLRDKAVFLRVPDTLRALQKLAKSWRSSFQPDVLAITGSNGKTIVKEWIYQIMGGTYRIVRSPRSYNSQIGVPLSLFHIRENHQLGLIEAGISQTGEMERLEDIIHPQWGLITNLGEAHQANFSDLKSKLNEKLRLFDRVAHLIYCLDHREIHRAIAKRKQLADCTFHTWSSKGDADVRIDDIRRNAEITTAKVLWKNENYTLELPFTDDASLENVMHAITFALAYGMSARAVFEAVKHLSPAAMRLELIKAIGHSSIINDAYNSDPQSIRNALHFLDQQHQHARRIVVLSDLIQSGMADDELYRQIAAMMNERKVDVFIGVGEKLENYARYFKVESHFYTDTESLIQNISRHSFSDAAILLKGARQFAFERLAKLLEERVHQTVLEINLSAVAHNLSYYRGLIRPETGIMAMVKAFAYGSGNYEIAHVLTYHNVNWLAVAYADEGVELRNSGVTTPIMVMNPGEDSFDSILEYNLEPEIFSLRMLQDFYRAYRRTQDNDPVSIHIKIETGMHRLGLELNEIPELLNALAGMPEIRVATAFSHLAAADNPELKDFTLSQFRQFEEASKRLESGLGYRIVKHMLNTAGIQAYPEYQMDMVRLGIGLYGITSDPAVRKHLMPVSRLITGISQIKHIGAGDSVGYDRAYIAAKKRTIATLPVGYADGLRRSLKGTGMSVWINGKRAPLVGNVCMDMIMVDVSDISCTEGDQAEVFGEHISVYELAGYMGTIPYEVLTSISSRVKRVYFQE